MMMHLTFSPCDRERATKIKQNKMKKDGDLISVKAVMKESLFAHRRFRTLAAFAKQRECSRDYVFKISFTSRPPLSPQSLLSPAAFPKFLARRFRAFKDSRPKLLKNGEKMRKSNRHCIGK